MTAEEREWAIEGWLTVVATMEWGPYEVEQYLGTDGHESNLWSADNPPPRWLYDAVEAALRADPPNRR